MTEHERAEPVDERGPGHAPEPAPDERGPEPPRDELGPEASHDDRVWPPDPAGAHRRHAKASLLPTRRPFDPPLPEVVQPREAPAFGAARAEAPPPPEAPKRSRFASRFAAITGALVLLAVVAVGALALLALGGEDGVGGDDAWSAWAPTSQGVEGATQIAAHVAPQYRLGGRQMVQVNARELEYRDTELEVVLRESAAQGGDIRVAEGDGILYELCGLGPSCAIDRGKPSNERGLLLSREALELALYSFRYLQGVDQVLVQFPARPGEQPMRMLHFTRGQLKAQLDRPLSASLVPQTPAVKDVALSPDAPLVGRLATTNVFLYQLRDGGLPDRLLLVLDPYTEEEETKRQEEARQERVNALRQAIGVTPAGG